MELDIAVIGIGALLPGADSADGFWKNVMDASYSIGDVPPERWRLEEHYDPDRSRPDKTYCKIGAFVKDFTFNSLEYRIPPRVAAAMDPVQQWTLKVARDALQDAGYLDKDFDRDRTGVVIANAMGGELQFHTAYRVYLDHVNGRLKSATDALGLDAETIGKLVEFLKEELPEISEDSMPGELSNIVSGRVANVLNLKGANYTVDAACAASLAAVSSAARGLRTGQFDMVLSGGADRSMGPATFVKFCKIGALSADGSFPFDVRANGFVMGEGASAFLLKRLEDAVRDGDKVYAVIKGVGASSDGKGKGITAPNPVGQSLALERGYAEAGVAPDTVGMVEAHGTSTIVGDAVEGEVLHKFFSSGSLKPGTVTLGSIKSQIGHLKGAAGAAGMLKSVLAIDRGVLPPSANFETPNPNIEFDKGPFLVHTAPKEWQRRGDVNRRAGVSSFGFGGTNFHVVLEEHRIRTGGVAVPDTLTKTGPTGDTGPTLFAAAADSAGELKSQLEQGAGGEPAADLAGKRFRVAFTWTTPEEKAKKAGLAAKVLASGNEKAAAALRGQGIFLGQGEPGKVAFLYPGQGSQYVGMLHGLAQTYPIVKETLDQADRVMEPILGRPLTAVMWPENFSDKAVRKEFEPQLKQTQVTQPAMLAADVAITRLLQSLGVEPDMVMGHSLGEYGALVSAGIMDFEEALIAVSGRANEMASLTIEDCGKMASVFGPFEEVQRILGEVPGYAIPANINSTGQTVVAGESVAIEAAAKIFEEKGFRAVMLPVSHAFHSRIVAPASKPLRKLLERLSIKPPQIPIVGNVDGRFYPTGPDAREGILDRLEQQIAAPVQFVRGLETLYSAGAKTYVEVGPKRVLASFADDVLGSRGILSLFANHPKKGDLPSFNELLCGLFAAGLYPPEKAPEQRAPATVANTAPKAQTMLVTGVSAGLPGKGEKLFAEGRMDSLLSGANMIDSVSPELKERMANQRIVRLKKRSDGGDPEFEEVTSPEEVIKLAGQRGEFDLVAEYGVEKRLADSLDITTQMALAATLEALKDAGIPMVRTYRTTRKGAHLPTGWALPASLRDETGVVFSSAFPGYNCLVDELGKHHRFSVSKALADMGAEISPEAADKLRSKLGIEADDDYRFPRDFLFRVLGMGHSQIAEFIGAKGPNVHVNAACASTTLALSTACDWISQGRCKRVIVVGADDITSEQMLPFFGSGFLALGAATTQAKVEDAALPFDRRRHGMIVGMGAVGLVVEEQGAAAARGAGGIAEILGVEVANSAFHGSRLDVEHISGVMEDLVAGSESRYGLDRRELASNMIFMSHETYTPARGGSAAAEVMALRNTFANKADDIVMTNVKGFTGHPMGVGLEDAIALRSLETGIVPPVPNFKEVDPDLGNLNLSKGGAYDFRYALRLAAGFGSQIAMALFRRVSDTTEREWNEATRAAWLKAATGLDEPVLVVENGTLKAVAEADAGNLPTFETAGSGAPASRPTALPQEATPAPAATGDFAAEVEAKLLGLIADKTGYPVDMLEPDLDLEADLGIDTVKQAEIFAMVRESYGIPRRDDLKLSDYPTIGAVVGFVLANTDSSAAAVSAPAPAPAPVTAPAPEPVPPPQTTPAAGNFAAEVQDRLLNLIAEKTGYPVDMLEPDLDLEADLGIDTVKQAEIFAMIRESYGIPRRDDLKLSDYPTIGAVVGFVLENSGESVTPAPSPEPAPEPAPEAVPAGGDFAAEVQDRLLNLIADKTGYPVDMLEPDLDLEADLGIDTVKQAEIFAMIRESYGIPRRDDLKLSDYPTIGAVVGFVLENASDAVAEPAAEAVAEATAEPTPEPWPEDGPEPVEDVQSRPEAPSGAQAQRFAAAGIKRLVPKIIAEPLVETNPVTPGGVVAIVGSRSKLLSSIWEQFKTEGFEVKQVRRTAKGGVGQVTEALAKIKNLQGVIFTLPGSLSFLPPKLAEFKKQLDDNVVSLFHAARAIREELTSGAGEGEGVKGGRFFATVIRADGRFGYGDGSDAFSPIFGAVSGFTKALSREFTGVHTTAIDVDSELDATAAAKTVFSEITAGAWKAEVGYRGDVRACLSMVHEPLDESGKQLLTLDDKSTVLLTGAGQGITARVARDIATRSGAKIAILDIVQLPDDPDALKKRLAGDETKLKAELFASLKNEGGRVTPAVVEKELGRMKSCLAVLDNLAWYEENGFTATYHVCDVTDPKAVEAAVNEIGTVDAVVHGAGLEESKSIEKKDPVVFERILFVKALGVYNLWTSCKDRGLKALAMFSSIAGRMGNPGQTDYSAANDLFSWFARAINADSGGATRGVSICWAGWEGVGMATRGSIPEILRRAGVTMIPPEAGTGVVAEELALGPNPEIVIAGALGTLDRDGAVLAEQHELAEGIKGAALPLELTALGSDGTATFEMVLDPKGLPMLEDHAIDGTPVLPGVMGLECFASVGKAFLPASNLAGFKDVAFSAPAKFHRNQPVKFVCRARKIPSGLHGTVAVRASLSSLFKAKVKGAKLTEKIHFEATVLLSGWLRPPVAGKAPSKTGDITSKSIYDVYFHGPSFQVLNAAGVEGKQSVGLLNPAIPDAGYVASPMLVELAFQTAGLWGIVTRSAMALPAGIGEIQFADAEPARKPAAAVASSLGDNLYDVTVLADDGTEVLSVKNFVMAEIPGRKAALEVKS